ncbi:MAG: regulatory protein RecX [Candidatus Berkiella sp.]
MKTLIRTKALYLLARRDHGKKELFTKLLRKGFPGTIIREVLDDLENENLLNNMRFIGSYIRFRSAKGYGPLKICAELGKRGIDHTQIRSSEVWQETPWCELAICARIKRFGEAIPQEKEQRILQARFLQYRGFTSEEIRSALSIAL